MTRKKSNVKALALAVTCAILAGGYSGLNPVYAADPVYHDVVKYDSANQTLDYEFDAGAGTGTAAIQKINFGNIVLDSSVIASPSITVGSYFSIDGSVGSISAAGGKFKVSDAGAITATSLSLGTMNDVAATINSKAAQSDVETNKNSIADLKTNKANKADVYTKEQSNSTFAGKAYEGKVDALETTVGSDSGGLVKDVKAVEDKTQKIFYDAATNTTTVNGIKFHTDASSGISDINDGIIKFSKNGSKDIVQINSDLMFNDDAGQQAATLTLEGVKTLNGLSNGSSKIEAGNGSAVGGVKFDSGNITGVNNATVGGTLNVDNIKSLDGHNEITVEQMATTRYNTDKISYNATDGTTIAGDVIVNKGADNQVKITDEGIVVGLTSAAINGDGFYAGGHNYNDAKAAIDGINGKIKGADGKFGVDDQGNVTTTGDIKGKDVTVEGKLSANGDAVVGGDLSVTGKANFAKETNFAGGITTDAINEATHDKGVTIDGVWLKDQGISAAGGAFTVDGASGNIVSKGTVSAADGKFIVDADGAVSAAGGNFGVDKDGNTTVGGKLEVADDTTLKGKLDVTGDTTLKGKLDVTGDATLQGNLSVAKNIKGQSLNIGTTGNEFTVDTLGNVNANGITTSDTTTNKIGGVTLSGSDINAKNLTLTGTLTAAKYNATDIEATNSIKVGATTMTDGKLDLGSNGTVDFGANELTDVQVGNINSVIQPGGIVKAADGSVIGGVSFSAKDITGVKDLTATGKVTAATITDGTASLSGGALTGLASVNIGGNTTIDNTGIKTNKLIVGSGLNATTIDEANGVVSAKGKIGDVKFTGAGKLENVTSIDGVSVAQNSGSAAGGLTFGGNAIIGATGIPFQSTGFKVDDDGDVEGKTFTTAADGTGNRSTLASGQLTIDPKNTWTKDNGIIASNVKVGTNELKDDGLHVGTNTLVKDGEITVGAGNSWSMANGIAATKAAINGVTIGETAGKAVFNKAGKSTTIDGDTIETGKITADELLIDKISLGKNGSSNISIDKDGHVQTKGDIKITDAAGNVMSKLSQDQATFGNNADNQTNINNGKLNAKAKNTANQQAEFNFDENGLTVSGQNAAGATSSFGFNAANGIGTFTGQDATTTAINGSAITSTNGGATGVLDGSNLTLTNGANSTALTAGGATFTGAAGEKGGTTTTINGGTITTDTLNVERINLGEDILDSNGTPHGSNLSMDKQGNFSAAGGNFTVKGGTGTDKGAFTNKVGNTTLQTDTTGASMKYNNGTVESNVSVGDDSAKISAGASSIEVKNDGITNTGVTTFKGAVDSSVPTTETTINGNTIKTGHLITDKLTITGSGAAAGTGSGSIAFGGNGSITSNIKDAATGKEATFKTDETGTFTEAKDSAGNKTTNTVNAQGNTNEVTDGTNTSTATQTATSIGGVVTNGTVKMKQELTAEGVKVTDELGDPANYTQITNKDVSITDPKNAGKRINLSDLGQLNDLDGELTARSEYTSNPTAVGAINAEAGIRREEVARLDNRIDDVNNRVDKVGAMAAAIASLKSIGYDPQAPSEFSIGLGQYKGETGVAMGFFHYPNKNFMINVSLSTAGGETMGGIGATWRFGHKSPQKLLDEQREAQARKELVAAEKYQAAAKLAKEAQERAEYAAKLARQAQVSADNAKAAADATQAKHFQ